MDIDATLQLLLDERDIVAVTHRYCRALDTKDWPALRTVFLEDATAQFDRPAMFTGIDAIVGRIRAALEHLDNSQHLVTNNEVVVDGDSATHRCYFQAQHVRKAADGSPNYIIAGRYEDRLTRADEGWRIAHRTLTVMWTEGNLDVVRH
jgi:ketosteroid isomerase-like protein